jgi:hypothetical protein
MRGKENEGLEDLNAVIARSPSHVNALQRRAKLLFSLGRLAEARSDAESVQKLRASDSTAELLRTINSIDQLMQQATLDSFNRVIELAPSYIPARAARAPLVLESNPHQTIEDTT